MGKRPSYLTEFFFSQVNNICCHWKIQYVSDTVWATEIALWETLFSQRRSPSSWWRNCWVGKALIGSARGSEPPPPFLQQRESTRERVWTLKLLSPAEFKAHSQHLLMVDLDNLNNFFMPQSPHYKAVQWTLKLWLASCGTIWIMTAILALIYDQHLDLQLECLLLVQL